MLSLVITFPYKAPKNFYFLDCHLVESVLSALHHSWQHSHLGAHWAVQAIAPLKRGAADIVRACFVPCRVQQGRARSGAERQWHLYLPPTSLNVARKRWIRMWKGSGHNLATSQGTGYSKLTCKWPHAPRAETKLWVNINNSEVYFFFSPRDN